MAMDFLAMMFRYRDGGLTFNFWYVVTLGTLMAAAGVWCVVAPESMRTRYFNVLNKLQRSRRHITPSDAWGWSSPSQIRLGGAVAIVLGLTAVTLVVFFAAPGVAY